MDEKARQPVGPDPAQHVVLGPQKDGATQHRVGRRLQNLLLGVRRQL